MLKGESQAIKDLVPYIGGHRPIYLHTVEELEKLFKGRKLKPGEQLPSEEVLAKTLGVSRSTVREALGYLETQGLIFKKQGSGTFVAHSTGKGFLGELERIEPFRDIAHRAGLVSKVVSREASVVNPNTNLVNALGVDETSQLVRVEVIEAINDIRAMYLVDYIKEDCCNVETLLNWEGSMITYLVERCSPPLTHMRSEIFAIGTDKIVASKLNVPVGKPILYQEETYFSSSGNIQGIGYLYILTDHFHFFVNRRVSKNL